MEVWPVLCLKIVTDFMGFYFQRSHRYKIKFCFCFIFKLGCNVRAVTLSQYNGKEINL
jgi:hypothetical protein